MELTREFHFDAAHYLPGHKGKCANMHGHTYRCELTVWGTVNPETGMVMDFGDLKNYIKAIEVRFDHVLLNEVMQKDPTAENILTEILDMMDSMLPKSILGTSVKLWEGLGNSVAGSFERIHRSDR